MEFFKISRRVTLVFSLAVIAVLALTQPTAAQQNSEEDAATEMARKLQDLLASISAIMTENDILFKTGQDDASVAFSIQPVKAWSFDKAGLNFIFRAVVPVMGLAPEAQRPIVGQPLPPGTGSTWGMGDIVTQYFFSPKTEGGWKWGVGPMVSLKTSTDPKLAGPRCGRSPSSVVSCGASTVVLVPPSSSPMSILTFPVAPGWQLHTLVRSLTTGKPVPTMP